MMGTIRAGDLNRRVHLQSFSGTRDNHGEIDRFDEGNWTTYATVWASVQPQGGNEGTEGDQVSPEVTHAVKVRYRKDTHPEHRVLYRKIHTTTGAAITTAEETTVTMAVAISAPQRNSFMLQVGTELMEVTDGHGTTTLTVTRGANNTTATTHANGADAWVLGILGIESVIDESDRRESLMLSCKETL